jgi:hypothetical protein
MKKFTLLIAVLASLAFCAPTDAGPLRAAARVAGRTAVKLLRAAKTPLKAIRPAAKAAKVAKAILAPHRR